MSKKLLFSIFLFSACSSSTNSETDAYGKRYTVVCRNEMQDCYNQSLKLCPKGYLVLNRVRGVRVGDQTDYTVILRCKDQLKK